MALGAQSGKVYLLILKEAGGLTAVGVVAGQICSVTAATLMRKLLLGDRVFSQRGCRRASLMTGTDISERFANA